MSHNDENVHTGTLQCFRKFRVSKNFVQRRGIPRAGDSRMLKMGQFAFRKCLCIKKGYHEIQSNIFCLTMPRIFIQEPFNFFRKFRVSKKFMYKKGISRISVGYFLSHSAENLHTGTLQYFRKFRISKKFMHKRGIPRAGDTKMLKMGHALKRFYMHFLEPVSSHLWLKSVSSPIDHSSLQGESC